MTSSTQRTAAGEAAKPIRICVFGSDPPNDQLLAAALPAGAQRALIGACARTTHWPDAQRLADVADAGDPLAATIAAAQAFPGEHLVMIRTDRALPALACERLLHALAGDGVLGAAALDEALRSPLPEGVDADDPMRLDAQCFAWSARLLADDPWFPGHPSPCCAWHGPRLAALDPESLRERDALDTAGLRVVVLDHLHVGAAGATSRTPSRPGDPRDPQAPSPLLGLRERVAQAHRTDVAPALPGLDHKPVLLHVLHGWGGGAERWVRDLAAVDSRRHHLVLVARGSFARKCHGEWLELLDGSFAAPPLRRVPLPRPIADTALADAAYAALLADILRDYCVDAIAVSSLIGHSLDVLRSGLPTLRIVHDHYPLWPRLHRDFGDPALAFDDAQLAADLETDPGREFADRRPAHWKRLREATVAALVAARASLVAPSCSALANELRLAPELDVLRSTIIAHGLSAWPQEARAPEPPPRERLRLLIPGRVRLGKGADLLRAALPGLREHAELFLLGAGADAHALFGEADVHVLLDYPREDLPALVARVAPDAALLLPTVAETFSYTLSELRSLGVPVIATRVGALSERIEDATSGFLIDPRADALIARIAQLRRDRTPLLELRARLANWREPGLDAMADAYADLLGDASHPPARYPLHRTDAALLSNVALRAELATARGHAATLATELAAERAESERRGDWGHALDRRIGTLENSLAKRSREVAELEGIRESHDRMLGSISWRITAPLRRANARLGGVRTSLAFRGHRLVQLARRTRGSLAQRGVAGTLARIVCELRGGSSFGGSVRYPHPRDDTTPFAVPRSATPRVSIVIPVHGKIAYTIACLRSIAEHAGDVALETIVVDDLSPDATSKRLAAIDGIRVLRNTENLGFVGSCNAGAALAIGEFVLFLNNDTLLTAGAIEALLGCFDEVADCGLAGAKLVYPDGRLQEAGGIVFDDGSGWNYGRFEDPRDPRYAFRREADYCSGAAILIRRALFERLGGFDARYAPAYYEDTDLAFAVRAAGCKVFYEPAATVVHFEGITAGTDTASGMKRYQVVNHDKFVEKWRTVLAAQPAPGTPIGRAATHRARARILIIDATTPTPDQDSGSMRMVNLMRVLGELGCQVSFLPDNRAWFERYTPALQDIGVEALYHPFVSDPVALFRERGREFDAIVLSRHYVAAGYIGLARLHAPQAKLVFDTVDLHYLREQRAAELSGKADLAAHAASTRAQELRIMRDCDTTLVVSPVEREVLAADAPDVRVEVLSNVHEIHGCRRPFGERRDLVFVGGFQHPPNTDAVTWFVTDIFPRVRAAIDGVRFHVIGSKVPGEIEALASTDVLVHGFVEDIAPYMDGCRVSVAPLRYGAGVKGKVNLAMSYGLPVVATPCAIEGMHVEEGVDVLVAGDAEAFADAIVRLYDDETMWNSLSANGLGNVRRHFSFDAAREAAARIFRLNR